MAGLVLSMCAGDVECEGQEKVELGRDGEVVEDWGDQGGGWGILGSCLD